MANHLWDAKTILCSAGILPAVPRASRFRLWRRDASTTAAGTAALHRNLLPRRGSVPRRVYKLLDLAALALDLLCCFL